jgi:hypothetical protein
LNLSANLLVLPRSIQNTQEQEARCETYSENLQESLLTPLDRALHFLVGVLAKGDLVRNGPLFFSTRIGPVGRQRGRKD